MRKSYPYISISNDTPDFYLHTLMPTHKDRDPEKQANGGKISVPITFEQSQPLDISLFFFLSGKIGLTLN